MVGVRVVTADVAPTAGCHLLWWRKVVCVLPLMVQQVEVIH